LGPAHPEAVVEAGSCRYNTASCRMTPFVGLSGRQSGRGVEMSSQSDPETVVPFAPTRKKAVSDDSDQLNAAGQAILKLLHKAAGVAEANSQHALDMAQKLSHQLRAAEDRVAELESQVQLYKEKGDRAERWLHKVYTEIEEGFIRRQEEQRRNILLGG
jgi:hypothetical protein